eukprot:scaffold273_cov89-Cylindrotheca_fusiformis.AAC.4
MTMPQIQPQTVLPHQELHLLLHNYGHVSLAGICSDYMEGRPIQFENEDSTPVTLEVLRCFIMRHPHAHTRVDPAGSLAALGKWNVETTKDHLDEVKEHLLVDCVISKIPPPEVTKYSKWIRSVTNAEEAYVVTPGSASQLSGRNRSYPTNPQEATIPSLLHFPSMQESYGTTATSTPHAYAQTARSSGSLTDNTPSERPNPQTDADMLGKREVKRLLHTGLDSIYEKLKLVELDELKSSISTNVKSPPASTATPTPTAMDCTPSNPSEDDTTEAFSTNDLIRQFMMESRASSQKLQDGQNGLYQPESHCP